MYLSKMAKEDIPQRSNPHQRARKRKRESSRRREAPEDRRPAPGGDVGRGGISSVATRRSQSKGRKRRIRAGSEGEGLRTPRPPEVRRKAAARGACMGKTGTNTPHWLTRPDC